MQLTLEIGRCSFELEASRNSLFIDAGPLGLHLSRIKSRRKPFSWVWRQRDLPPGERSWHPTRERTLHATWRGLELVLDWTRPVPGTVGLNPHEPADGDWARVAREEAEELAKFEATHAATQGGL